MRLLTLKKPNHHHRYPSQRISGIPLLLASLRCPALEHIRIDLLWGLSQTLLPWSRVLFQGKLSRLCAELEASLVALRVRQVTLTVPYQSHLDNCHFLTNALGKNFPILHSQDKLVHDTPTGNDQVLPVFKTQERR